MLAVIRFRVGAEDETDFLEAAERAVAVLAEQPGHVDAQLGRATDEPALWALVTRWESIGSYRRALSAYDVRMSAVPLLSRAIDEPTAFEVVRGEGATEPNRSQPRGSDKPDPGSLGPSPSHRQPSRTE